MDDIDVTTMESLRCLVVMYSYGGLLQVFADHLEICMQSGVGVELKGSDSESGHVWSYNCANIGKSQLAVRGIKIPILTTSLFRISADYPMGEVYHLFISNGTFVDTNSTRLQDRRPIVD